MAAHAPLPRFSSTAGERAAELFDEECRFHRIPLVFNGAACVAKISHTAIKTIAILQRLLRIVQLWKLPLWEESRQRSGITGTRNFDLDHVDARRRLALPELFGRGRCTQAEESPPLRAAENTGNGAAAGHFDSLQLAPSRLNRMKASSFEGCDPNRLLVIEANSIRRLHVSESVTKLQAASASMSYSAKHSPSISATTRASPSGITRMMPADRASIRRRWQIEAENLRHRRAPARLRSCRRSYLSLCLRDRQ